MMVLVLIVSPGILAVVLNDGICPKTGIKLLKSETVKGKLHLQLLLNDADGSQKCSRTRFQPCRDFATRVRLRENPIWRTLVPWFPVPTI